MIKCGLEIQDKLLLIINILICRGMLGDGAALPLTTEDLQEVGLKLFFSGLSCYATSLLDTVVDSFSNQGSC
jgi:hypothetical protein